MYGWILCALKSIHATSPSLAGQTVVKTGSSPDSASSLVRSSQFLSDFHQTCSALQWRDRAGISPVFPIKPLQAPVLYYAVVLLGQITFTNKKPLYTNAKRLYKISFPSLVGQTVISNRQFS